ncbi:hypothetical protein PQG65_06325 [Corynebacterium pseudodiphtheriticum]|nr:hypothetical protein [Corynebacterium pseudodiphtheriticum]ERJ47227.1 hypothetical protein N579_00575 [Corynebacterium pseudodiphtheriticum 090104]MDC7110988.1 hypothetical protein [Corynebacterium pseudodiphtheriticum]MDC7114944.1 hypothetical protein [Corynebacterium pseudodiphtheriticum]MDK4237374.1 hypothetical protein [Corynebacterium pseudodiphtheriticum]MDK4284052.1 hypothetical protein [Corynebacterium pseudodiphtheriticum]
MTDLPQLFADELGTTIGVEDQAIGYVTTQDLSHAQCTFNQVRILHTTHRPAEDSAGVSIADNA